MAETFTAFTVGSTDAGWFREVRSMSTDELMAGEVLIKVSRSGVNYKDGLASTETGRIARINPLIPGVDLAGVVVESSDASVGVGDEVIVHGYDVGVAHHGGYAGYARVPAAWVVPLPAGLTAEQAMFVGTAGFTSALSVDALEQAGLTPGSGHVVVTGATGGVGSMAIGMLAARGYEVVASSGKADAADWLRSIGASEVIDREGLAATSKRPLEGEKWAGAVDCVGGTTLASVIRQLKYGASVAASGLTGGGDLPTTVFPFILRGVNLLGIDSVMAPIEHRRAMWHRIATDLRPGQLDTESPTVIGLADLPENLDRILAGGITSRVVVDPWR